MLSRRLFLQALSAPVLLSALPRAALADELDSIKKAGVLRVGVPQDFPPFGFMGSDMKLQGYDIEMARYLARALGVRCQLIPVTNANRVPYLQSRKADIMVSTLGKTPARAKVVDFTVAYAPCFLGVFGPASLKIAKPADLAGHSVSLTRGSVEDQTLSPVLPKSTVVKRYEDTATTAQAYLSGQTELIAFVSISIGAIAPRAAASRKPELKFMLKNSPNYVGVPKGEKRLLAAANEAITRAFRDGTIDGWSRKFLGSPAPADLLRQEPRQVKF